MHIPVAARADLPFSEALKRGQAIINQGGVVFQVHTCQKCKKRQVANLPNYFYHYCICKDTKCGAVTVVVNKGCNFIQCLELTANK